MHSGIGRIYQGDIAVENIDITLPSDMTHRMGKDYGVLIEEEGICLRAMFILDPDGIVQHVNMDLFLHLNPYRRFENDLTRPH
jgi:alkyl hydroperoxide reductase subunit AhpC